MGAKIPRSFSDNIIDALRSNQTDLYDDVVFSPINVTDLIRIVHELVDSIVRVFNVCARDSVSKYEFDETGEVSGFELGIDTTNQVAIACQIERPLNLSLSDKKLRSD